MNSEVLPSIEVVLASASKQLADVSDSPLLDAKVLLADVFEQTLTYLITWHDKQLTEVQLSAFQQMLDRRLAGEPIAYIVGVKEFWSLPFFVAPSTLIPRPDTETLIELVLANHQANHQPNYSPNHDKGNLQLLDLGTGTGAIALALASENPSWQVQAVDFNPDAVKLAQRNAQHLALNHVKIYQSDWFSEVNAQSNEDKFDIIVSNPPYIDEADPHLVAGDVRFEPKSALVADNQGLADIEHIVSEAKSYLASGGAIYLEHGYQQGQAVRGILIANGYQNAQTEQDLAGNDRITWACLA
ncbi:peptide chain release factor N(5)-glutamine methyltransferase [Thalassotalea euphylliae]|uniref:Release factor glutamine methyltransferase n=1 Tax=Thalassotalea euphylliae TaxID=1655234 RepID=A0A3E0U9S9_9GAMM|nr:peptide chain release factor N(5)-glutamine methyltransferase [Thalassotalea euphylliae]REL32602.1 peptide chain release factor N(5)-glutamine methyltransferase [Thalassotalea euphylliae]